jgi:hypothetical protein
MNTCTDETRRRYLASVAKPSSAYEVRVSQGDQQQHFAEPRLLSDPNRLGPKAEVADQQKQGAKTKAAK